MDILTRSLTAFKDPNILKKAGIILILMYIPNLVSFALNMLNYNVSFGSSFLNEQLGEGWSSSWALLYYIAAIGSSIIFFPISLYTQGYTYQIANRMRSGISDPLPEHDDIKGTLKLGLGHWAYSFAFTFPIVLLIAALIILVIFAMISGQNSEYALLMIVAVIGIFITVILSFLLLAASSIVVPIMMYIYQKEHTFVAAFSPGKVWYHIQTAGLDLFILFGLKIVGNTVAGIAAFVLCCAGPLVTPVISIIFYLFSSALIGSLYYNLDQRLAPGQGSIVSGSSSVG